MIVFDLITIIAFIISTVFCFYIDNCKYSLHSLPRLKKTLFQATVCLSHNDDIYDLHDVIISGSCNFLNPAIIFTICFGLIIIILQFVFLISFCIRKKEGKTI